MVMTHVDLISSRLPLKDFCIEFPLRHKISDDFQYHFISMVVISDGFTEEQTIGSSSINTIPNRLRKNCTLYQNYKSTTGYNCKAKEESKRTTYTRAPRWTSREVSSSISSVL